MADLYLFLSSTDSPRFCPYNSPSEFVVRLPETFHLEGKWTCALKEIKCTTTKNVGLYVFCDLVTESVVKGRKLPILQHISQEVEGRFVHSFDLSIAPLLSRKTFHEVYLYIRDEQMNPAPLAGDPTSCTLLLRRS